jgi:hypothetical protein
LPKKENNAKIAFDFLALLPQGVVVVAMGVFQVLFMRQLFKEKTSNFNGGRMGV